MIGARVFALTARQAYPPRHLARSRRVTNATCALSNSSGRRPSRFYFFPAAQKVYCVSLEVLDVLDGVSHQLGRTCLEHTLGALSSKPAPWMEAGCGGGASASYAKAWCKDNAECEGVEAGACVDYAQVCSQSESDAVADAGIVVDRERAGSTQDRAEDAPSAETPSTSSVDARGESGNGGCSLGARSTPSSALVSMLAMLTALAWRGRTREAASPTRD